MRMHSRDGSRNDGGKSERKEKDRMWESDIRMVDHQMRRETFLLWTSHSWLSLSLSWFSPPYFLERNKQINSWRERERKRRSGKSMIGEERPKRSIMWRGRWKKVEGERSSSFSQVNRKMLFHSWRRKKLVEEGRRSFSRAILIWVLSFLLLFPNFLPSPSLSLYSEFSEKCQFQMLRMMRVSSLDPSPSPSFPPRLFPSSYREENKMYVTWFRIF